MWRIFSGGIMTIKTDTPHDDWQRCGRGYGTLTGIESCSIRRQPTLSTFVRSTVWYSNGRCESVQLRWGRGEKGMRTDDDDGGDWYDVGITAGDGWSYVTRLLTAYIRLRWLAAWRSDCLRPVDSSVWPTNRARDATTDKERLVFVLPAKRIYADWAERADPAGDLCFTWTSQHTRVLPGVRSDHFLFLF